MKFLKGSELADYIKQRQVTQIGALRRNRAIVPRLAIIHTTDDPVIATYIKLKQSYGQDILAEVAVYKKPQQQLPELIERLNRDQVVHGIIIQLPLSDPTQTGQLVNMVAPQKDIDGLGKNALLDGPTPTAINWLLAGYNIDLKFKKIVIVGNGRLVGGPLARIWRGSNYDVTTLDQDDDLKLGLKNAELIVSAVGAPELLASDMIPIGCTVVDAGVSSDSGKTAGDVADDVYSRSDLTITPQKGGVGPLTVAALFENVIRAAEKS